MSEEPSRFTFRAFLRKHTTGIVTSLFATLLFIYFLDPILRAMARVFILATSALGQAFTDRLYAQAAHLQTINYSFFLFTYSFIPLLVGATLLLRRGARALVPRNAPPAKRISLIPAGQPTFFHASGLLLAGLAIVIWVFAVASANYIQLSLISTFERHMRVLDPYISDAQRKRLISDWSMMETEHDYNLLQAQLETLAENNKVRLPENKIYSPFTL